MNEEIVADQRVGLLPDFVIVGAQKAASTFLTHCLHYHPDIFIPLDEVKYFETPEFETLPLESLTQLFGGRTEKVLGIKRPNYLCLPELPGRIHGVIPKAKIIVILRNPLERTMSAYFHSMAYGFIPIKKVEVGLNKVLDGAYDRKYTKASEIISFSLYNEPLLRYRKLFGKENVLILFQDDIVSNKLDSMKLLYEFLGVDPSFIPPTIDSRPAAVIYNIFRLKFTASVNALRYKYYHQGTKVLLKERNLFEKLVTKTVSRIDSDFLLKLLGNEKPTISAALRTRLLNTFIKDIENLEKLLGRDLSSWKH